MENNLKEKVRKALAEHLAEVTVSQYRKPTPIMEGDVLTFSLKDENDIKRLCENVAATAEIGAYRMLNTDEGHRLSQSQLTRQNNGLNLPGKTPDEALNAFFDMLMEAPVKLKVVSSKVQESTRRNRDAQRVLKFQKL